LGFMAAKVVKKGDRWEVLVDGLTYDYFDDESEAKKVAKLLEKAEKTIEEIRELAQDILNKLTHEERKFLYEYTNGSIEVEVIP